jgi:hypothetical protein
VLIVILVLPGDGLARFDQDVVWLELLIDDADRRNVSDLRALFWWQSVMVIIVMTPATRAGVVMIVIVVIASMRQHPTARANSGHQQRRSTAKHLPSRRSDKTVNLRFRRIAREIGAAFTFVVKASHVRFRASTNPISVSGTVPFPHGTG